MQRIFFIGIGGIGMSALARYFHQEGMIVSGYDKTKTVLTQKLEEEGIKISYVDQIEILDQEADLVVYTPAIPKDHIGLNWYQERDYIVKKRAEVLADISRTKKSICIGGTHGKTSTSSITTYLLRACGIEISAFVGGIMKDFSSNFVFGNEDWVVLEADEYDRSFWQLSPNIAAIMSMDADHLDIYGSEDVMQEGFEGFIQKIGNGGTLFIREPLQNALSEVLIEELNDRNVHVHSFGIEQGAIQAINVRVENGKYVFDYQWGDIRIQSIAMQLPGKHNVENALVAISTALTLGANSEQIRLALPQFGGIKRRFEVVSEGSDYIIIDDYAHHPTELKMAIDAARTLYPDRKIMGIFQPHLFSRTNDFYQEFAKELSELDECILLPIYPARELPMEGVASEMIAREMSEEKVNVIEKAKVLDYLNNKTEKIEVLLVLGAGDIDTLPVQLKAWAEAQN